MYFDQCQSLCRGVKGINSDGGGVIALEEGGENT